ncbi:U3 small nucleolar ribonucleoprotein protein IMP4 [Nilaparvata lugens]|uniref:U3 small nucleolar ribonucleoprotein protein IMP4 n=1 Tax=Nilaparvata lugens TaxID=108931 RepID=UPI000B98B230|nr:U3 small nucleolar ribonucleoprotein protein IMP4 [Nilaparvata lugens]
MLRRQARLRREYLFRKALENRRRVTLDKKERLKRSLEEGTQIDTDLRRHALKFVDKVQWDDKGPELAVALGTESGGGGINHEDDEYRWAGVEDPKIMITTSRDPSSRLKMFVKELRLILPNSQRMNRGNYEMKQLVHACRANDVTDFIIVHEHRGVPNSLVICHLPYGPTAYFTISDVTMRHDIPDLGTMSEQFPHLIFHNFTTKLGTRVSNILKYLFPVPKEDSRRVITFANHNDYITFRHHMYKKVNGKDIELTEVGPRFMLRLYEIKLGTIDTAAASDTEWALRPYMNTAIKRRFLSFDDGWKQDDDFEEEEAQ